METRKLNLEVLEGVIGSQIFTYRGAIGDGTIDDRTLKTGFYATDNSTKDIPAAATSKYGMLLVFRKAANNITQIWSSGYNEHFIRYKHMPDTNFRPWKKMA